MHRGYLLFLGLASGLALSVDALARPTVSTDAVPGVNFSAYRTYSWANGSMASAANPVMQQRIVADFDAALASKGYQKAADPADLSLILTIGAQNKTDVQSWGRFGLQTSIYQYTQGQLSLDVFDTKTNQALWHGQVTETVNPSKPNSTKVDAAIAKLMQQFPATAAVPASPAAGEAPPQ
jgi:hypothetical protein